ncbi:MAG: DUF302 domain-containing protein [Bacteroidales bacterium]|nr:DUF302 domain-containing protein [Bacteroidales bacterium]
MKYYISKKIKASFDQAVERTLDSIKHEGFEVISEIDMNEKFKSNLQIDFRRYKILGVCNLTFSYQALIKEDKIGTMLPCNIIIQELPDGKIEVAAIDPYVAMQAINNPELMILTKDVRNKLKQIIENVY